MEMGKKTKINNNGTWNIARLIYIDRDEEEEEE